MQRHNIVTSRVYTDKQGNEKKQWNNVGTLTQLDNGNFILELNMFPDTKFGVFPQKEKEQLPF